MILVSHGRKGNSERMIHAPSIPPALAPSRNVSALLLGFCLAFSGCIQRDGLTGKEELESFISQLGDRAEAVLVEDGYAEARLQGDDQALLGTLTITDLKSDPDALAEFQKSSISVGGYPAASASNLGNETEILIGNRYQFRLRSDVARFDERARIGWLKSNAITLDKLARSQGPPVAWMVSVLAVATVFVMVLLLLLKVQSFLALLLASIVVGIGAGMPLMEVVRSMTDGMGNSLGYIAAIIGLGAILGKVLEFSGGAEGLARALIKALGQKRAPCAMVLTGFLISIPVFFDIGLVIFIPILYALARETKKTLLYLGLPLAAGMAAAHAFIPPTPGPILVAANLDVSLGWVMLFGFIVGLPTAIIAGPWLGCKLAKKHLATPLEMGELGIEDQRQGTVMKLPGLWMILFIVGLPIAMILASTVLDLLLERGRLNDNTAIGLFIFLGHPIIALLISTMLAMYLLGTRRGLGGDKLLELSTASLAPVGIIVLVTGAGGVLERMLGESGMGQTLVDLIGASALSPVVLAYLFAVMVRVAQGSATVSMIVASSLMAPVVDSLALGAMPKALVAVSIAAGATFLSHANDSGFRMVSRYFGLTEKQTLQTWTLVTTVISLAGFLITWVLSWVIFRI